MLLRTRFSLSCSGQFSAASHTPYADRHKDLLPAFLQLSQGHLRCPESLLGGTQALSRSAGTESRDSRTH